jgi:hypothetical protein
MQLKRKLTRVREGVTLEPGESLYYDKNEGYTARKPASTRVGTEKGRDSVGYPKLTADDHEAGAMQAESDRAKTKKYAGGGKVRGCGAASRGLTKGKMR